MRTLNGVCDADLQTRTLETLVTVRQPLSNAHKVMPAVLSILV